MVFSIRFLVCFFSLAVLVHCIPLDNGSRVGHQLVLPAIPLRSKTPLQDTFEQAMLRQLGGGLLGGGNLGGGGGGGNFGGALAGSVIGSALATILPTILRPIGGVASGLLPRLGQRLSKPQNYDAYVMNMPGTKDAYLYLTLAPEAVEDAPKENEENNASPVDAFDFPYLGTKLGTVNIRAPPSNLEVDESLSAVKNEDVYEEDEYRR